MKRWEKGSQAMVTVDAIFAGLSGALAVALLIAEGQASCGRQIAMGLGLFSFILFALAAEKITDALDESKVKRYVRSMLIYNIAVVLLFLSVAALLLARRCYLPALIPVAGIFYPWLADICWLLFAPKADREAYVEDLCTDD